MFSDRVGSCDREAGDSACGGRRVNPPQLRNVHLGRPAPIVFCANVVVLYRVESPGRGVQNCDLQRGNMSPGSPHSHSSRTLSGRRNRVKQRALYRTVSRAPCAPLRRARHRETVRKSSKGQGSRGEHRPAGLSPRTPCRRPGASKSHTDIALCWGVLGRAAQGGCVGALARNRTQETRCPGKSSRRGRRRGRFCAELRSSVP